MSWLDKPTKAQIDMLWHWYRWKLPTGEARDALDWLEQNATRKQVSDEMGRVRELYKSHSLSREDCFNAPIWQEYFNSKVGKE